MQFIGVTSVRDEGPFLLEWIAWHQILGVEHFIIASNDCRDGTDQMLEVLAETGLVTHLPLGAVRDKDDGTKPGKAVQWQALKAAWAHPRAQEAEWMLISDLDEFPMIHCGAHRLADLVAAVGEDVDAIALPWRLFGYGSQIDYRDLPVTQIFTQCAPADMAAPVAATFFKSLFRPRAFAKPGVHRPLRAAQAGPARWVGGDGKPLPAALCHDKRLSLIPVHAGRELAEMHHYSLRSLESFVLKSERGLPNRSSKPIDLTYWVMRNFNSVQNIAALGWGPALEQEMARLKAIPQLGELHEKACLFARDRFKSLIATPEGYELWVGAMQAGSSAILPDVLAARIYEQYHKLK